MLGKAEAGYSRTACPVVEGTVRPDATCDHRRSAENDPPTEARLIAFAEGAEARAAALEPPTPGRR